MVALASCQPLEPSSKPPLRTRLSPCGLRRSDLDTQAVGVGPAQAVGDRQAEVVAALRQCQGGDRLGGEGGPVARPRVPGDRAGRCGAPGAVDGDRDEAVAVSVDDELVRAGTGDRRVRRGEDHGVVDADTQRRAAEDHRADVRSDVTGGPVGVEQVGRQRDAGPSGRAALCWAPVVVREVVAEVAAVLEDLVVEVDQPRLGEGAGDLPAELAEPGDGAHVLDRTVRPLEQGDGGVGSLRGVPQVAVRAASRRRCRGPGVGQVEVEPDDQVVEVHPVGVGRQVAAVEQQRRARWPCRRDRRRRTCSGRRGRPASGDRLCSWRRIGRCEAPGRRGAGRGSHASGAAGRSRCGR